MSAGVESLALDVDQQGSVDACLEQVWQTAGRLDVLVNNAGYLLAGAVEEASLEEAKAVFETNYFGVLRMTLAALPRMREQGFGHIITVSSLAGLVPVPFWGHYNASKFAVEGLMETLRLETRPFGIKVCMVEPAAIHTAFYDRPPAKAMEAYARRQTAMKTVMKGFDDKAPGPALVAAKVAKLALDPDPALRNLVTKEAHLFAFLRWVLPARLNEFGLRQAFKI
jgi:NAD(P)-dependent dehydrogenase (short-subunit alcohol dehydrogenase family)